MTQPLKITSISDIRRYFLCNEQPLYFVSATNFNLLGIDEWIKGFKFISYIDSYDGRHANMFSPSERPHPYFTSIEEVNNYLLRHPEVVDYMARRGGTPRLVFLVFDEQSEALAAQLGAEVWFPPASLRRRIDDKIETVRIGERAGVPSVPNRLAAVADYAALRRIADEAGLGRDLVLQLPFGDSGQTTFFVRDEQEFAAIADAVVGKGEVKIMRRIRCQGSAIEACTTKKGTVVGPLMTELIGFPELTPYRGGWCGNEVFAGAFSQEIRDKAREYTLAMGEQLRKEGYRGYFELDFLIDLDSGELWLGELNPRITGASPMTNHAAFAYADVPLFLFHLLEYSDVEFDLDLTALSDRWSDPDNIDCWSQLAIKHTDATPGLVTAAPESGIYRMLDDGRVVYDRFDHHRHSIESDREAFLLRILRTGDYLYQGADLGILITRGRSMDADYALTPRAHQWIAGIKRLFQASPVPDHRGAAEAPLVVSLKSVGSALYQQSYDSEGAGRYAEALAAIERLPEALRSSYLAEYRRGYLLHRMGRHLEASEVYASAASRAPGAVEPRLARMLPLMAERRYADAGELAREVLRVDPLNYYATLRLAFIHYCLGEYAAAVAGYRKLSRVYPGDIEVKSGLGWALLRSGQALEAELHFREIIDVAPRHALAIDGLLAISAG
jgi:hypothetical protein